MDKWGSVILPATNPRCLPWPVSLTLIFSLQNTGSSMLEEHTKHNPLGASLENTCPPDTSGGGPVTSFSCFPSCYFLREALPDLQT